MQAAWTKAVILTLTLWARPFARDQLWWAAAAPDSFFANPVLRQQRLYSLPFPRYS